MTAAWHDSFADRLVDDYGYVSDDQLDAIAALDYTPCDGHREDGEPCGNMSGHAGDCWFPGEWRI